MARHCTIICIPEPKCARCDSGVLVSELLVTHLYA